MSPQIKHWGLGLFSFLANVKPNFKYSALYKRGFSVLGFLLLADNSSTIYIPAVSLSFETDTFSSFDVEPLLFLITNLSILRENYLI